MQSTQELFGLKSNITFRTFIRTRRNFRKLEVLVSRVQRTNSAPGWCSSEPAACTPVERKIWSCSYNTFAEHRVQQQPRKMDCVQRVTTLPSLIGPGTSIVVGLVITNESPGIWWRIVTMGAFRFSVLENYFFSRYSWQAIIIYLGQHKFFVSFYNFSILTSVFLSCVPFISVRVSDAHISSGHTALL